MRPRVRYGGERKLMNALGNVRVQRCADVAGWGRGLFCYVRLRPFPSPKHTAHGATALSKCTCRSTQRKGPIYLHHEVSACAPLPYRTAKKMTWRLRTYILFTADTKRYGMTKATAIDTRIICRVKSIPNDTNREKPPPSERRLLPALDGIIIDFILSLESRRNTLP